MKVDPIFIVGCGRSGTTLLRLILNRHSAIAIPEETWYFPQLFQELPNLLREEYWRKAVARRILELNHIHFPELAPEALEDAMKPISKDDLPGIVSIVNREFMLRENKRRWGDKTPGYVLNLKIIRDLFPSAKVLHIVRDGRDVVPSILKYWSVGPQTNSFIETTAYWRNHVMAGVLNGPKNFSDQYKEIRYEDLVSDPEKTVRDVCAFIGEDFEPAMLVSPESGVSYTPEWKWHGETRKEITSRNVGKWKGVLNNYQVAVVEYIGRSIFRKFGYSFSSGTVISAYLSCIWFLSRIHFRKILLAVKVAIHNRISKQHG